MPGLILPTADVMSIEDRIRRGDPIVGWQGDPSMDLYIREDIGEAGVYGFDRAGDRYLAATVSLADPGWRHTLLQKLRDGDWRTDHGRANGQRIVAHNEAVAKAQEDDLDEKRLEFSERLAWALERDLGPHVTGSSRRYF